MAFTTAPSLSVIFHLLFPAAVVSTIPEVTKRWKRTLLEQNLSFFEAGSTSLNKIGQARANSDITFGHMLRSYQQSTLWFSTLSCHTAVHKCTIFLSPYFDKECCTRPGHQNTVNWSSCSLVLQTLLSLDSIYLDFHLFWFMLIGSAVWVSD